MALLTLSAAASPAFWACLEPLVAATLEAELEAEDASEEMLARTEAADFEATLDAESADFDATDDAEDALLPTTLVAETPEEEALEAPRPI